MKKRKSSVSLIDWIIRCDLKHNKKYDYSKSFFEYLTDEVIIICDKHGEFKMNAGHHLKSGCIRCSKNKKFHIDDVKILLNESKIFDIPIFHSYTGNRQKIEVVCKKNKHSSVKSISHILANVGCSHCSKKHKCNKQEWINICSEVHKNKYDYSKSEYLNTNSKVIICCPIHGDFKQIARTHKNGAGCKKCNRSIGENIISEILNSKNIKYYEQKTFDGLIFKSNLYFDFYLPDYNLCIEFDGLQHKTPYDFFGGESALSERMKRDEIKNAYCENKNIYLLRISYQINYKCRNNIYFKIKEKIESILNEI
jgi:very-short-patch-repair endonuclease